jgi:hypothetical protein
VPSSVAWPAGLNYTGASSYDCASGTFLEEDNPYDFSQLGPKYIDGEGWNGVGFPSFQVMQFVDNSTPRPQIVLRRRSRARPFRHRGVQREWSRLLSAIDAYLVARGWEDKGYYYVQNEPQGPEDYDVAAFLAALTKQAAPNLRIAVSEEPKPEIAEHPMIGAADVRPVVGEPLRVRPEYAKAEQAGGDGVVVLPLRRSAPALQPDHHRSPRDRVAHPHWSAYNYRMKGFAYYSVTGWGDDPRANPRPRARTRTATASCSIPLWAESSSRAFAGRTCARARKTTSTSGSPPAGACPTPDTIAGCDATVAERRQLDDVVHPRRLGAACTSATSSGITSEGKRDGCPSSTRSRRAPTRARNTT